MERWEALRDELDTYTEAGATVVAVCQAEPERAAAVATRRGYRFRSSATRSERRTTPMHSWREPRPRSSTTFRGARATRRRADDVPRAAPGHGAGGGGLPWQLPGEFVVAVDGRIQLAHRYQYCEDFPPKTVLLGAVAAAQR